MNGFFTRKYGVVLAFLLSLSLLFTACETPADLADLPEQNVENAAADLYSAERLAEARSIASEAAKGQAWAAIGAEEAAEEGLLILVNKQHPLKSDYVPADLADVKYYASDRSASCRYLISPAADAFHKMAEAAKSEAGLTILMTTAYRSYNYQKVLWDNYVAKDGEAKASIYSARPGTSEHQSGLAVDVSSPSIGNQLVRDFAGTQEGRWLADNAHRFGFILRYPQNGEDITGYMYEPWHFRYVGPEAAETIHRLSITLEEYLVLQYM